MSQCWKYVQKSGSKSPPSPGCCAALKPVDLSCACPYVSKSVEGYVSMDKVVYVARTCGMNLAAGTKCGSKYSIASLFWDELSCYGLEFGDSIFMGLFG
ncbi:hypothetical protein LINPERHAP1_LOCUS4241 [Linum perenne]